MLENEVKRRISENRIEIGLIKMKIIELASIEKYEAK